MANEVAPAFASVPGLIGKIRLADAGKDTYGGVYIWQDAAAIAEEAEHDTRHCDRRPRRNRAVLARALCGEAAGR